VTSRPLRYAYLGFAMLGAAVLGAFVYDRLAARRGATAVPPPASSAHPSAASGAPTVPARIPAVTLKDLDGRPRALGEFAGRSLVINFWATWCAPCRREIPLLNRIQREYAGKGFEVVGIAVDFAEDVRAYVQRVPIDYPLLTGEEDGLEAARAFGVASMAFPFTAFTDRAGDVVTVHLGELHALQAEAILAIVARIDSGELGLEAARTAVREALRTLPAAASSAEKPAAG
jgi:thiol-disulfide isomerase/thioredoxin